MPRVNVHIIYTLNPPMYIMYILLSFQFHKTMHKRNGSTHMLLDTRTRIFDVFGRNCVSVQPR